MAFNLDLNFLFALLDLFTGFIKEANISEVTKLDTIPHNLRAIVVVLFIVMLA